MKRILLGIAALISSAAVHAEITVHMNVELKKDNCVQEMTVDCTVNPNEVVRVISDELEVEFVAEPQEDGKVELTFAIERRNEDGSCTIISQPVLRTDYDQEATVSIGNNHEDMLLVSIVAHQHDTTA